MVHVDRFRTALVAALAGVATVGAASPPPYPSPPPVVVTCGSTITVDTTLTHDLECPELDGIGLVLAEGVTLDLGGHALVGPGAQGGGAGVTTQQRGGDTELRHGTVRGWPTGVVGDNLTVSEVVVEDSDIGVASSEDVVQVERSVLRDNRVGARAVWSAVVLDDTVVTGSDVGAIADNDFATVAVHGSTFRDNVLAVDCAGGYVPVTGSRLERNGTAMRVRTWDCTGNIADSTVVGNGVGLETLRSPFDDGGFGPRVERTTFRGNGTGVAAASSTFVVDSTFRGNTLALTASGSVHDILQIAPVTHLSGTTFRSNGDAVVLDMAAEIGTTSAIANRGVGIHAPGAVDLGGNVAYGNGVEPQCLGVVCAGRPRS